MNPITQPSPRQIFCSTLLNKYRVSKNPKVLFQCYFFSILRIGSRTLNISGRQWLIILHITDSHLAETEYQWSQIYRAFFHFFLPQPHCLSPWNVGICCNSQLCLSYLWSFNDFTLLQPFMPCFSVWFLSFVYSFWAGKVFWSSGITPGLRSF